MVGRVMSEHVPKIAGDHTSGHRSNLPKSKPSIAKDGSTIAINAISTLAQTGMPIRS